MPKIRITKEFNFEMAHALLGYDGSCRHIHGHSYKLFVTIAGKPVMNHNSPKLGMVMDFGDLKNIVRECITDVFDHALVLNKNTSIDHHPEKNGLFGKLILVDYQPTTENLLIDFADRISKKLPAEVQLHNLKLWETITSYAEWFADENE